LSIVSVRRELKILVKIVNPGQERGKKQEITSHEFATEILGNCNI
jgi:hypothetical protein